MRRVMSRDSSHARRPRIRTWPNHNRIVMNIDPSSQIVRPIAAPLIGEERTDVGGDDHSTRALLLRLNRPANLAGAPAISTPCGVTAMGLPVGLQFIGTENNEEELLEIAERYERLNPPTRAPIS